jgi:hypothetical protein
MSNFSRITDTFQWIYEGVTYDFYHVEFLTVEAYKDGVPFGEFACMAEARVAAFKDAGYNPIAKVG